MIIKVAQSARDAYAELDEPLRAELREHAARVADAPIELLRRSLITLGNFAFEYESVAADDLRVILVFGEPDFERDEVWLMAILRTGSGLLGE